MDHDSPQVRIRRAQSYDLNDVVALYEGCGLVPSARGFRNELTRKLLNDPDLFLVAVEPDARIVAAMVAGFDARVVTVSRLATHPERRRGGLASLLVEHLERELARLGARSSEILVVDDTPDGRHFWTAVGYERVRHAPVYRERR